jgi:hypothetical protein
MHKNKAFIQCHLYSTCCIQLAGGTIAYKTKFQPTVALSTTEAEFMAACDVGRMSLLVRSILWDLDVPQETATIAYEDNDGCTAMGNAQKPTTRTRHIDIKYFTLCEWFERDLIHLERIDTSINIADHLTKPLTKILFYRHADYLLVKQLQSMGILSLTMITQLSSTLSSTHACPLLLQPP